MAWNTYTVGTAALDDSLVLAFSDLVYFGAQPQMIVDQLAIANDNIVGKSLQISKYSDLTQVTSALTEMDEDTAEAMTDSSVVITPAQYGKSTIRTELSRFQTGGKVDRAAAIAIANNMARSLDGLGFAALEGGSPLTTIYPNGKTAVTQLGDGDVLDKTFANRLYNKLARRNTPPKVNGLYAAIAHDDVLYDLRDSMTDILKYSLPPEMLRNAVGVFGGFVWYRDGLCAVTANASGTFDSYKVLAIGDNVLIKGTSQQPQIVITGPFDRLGRFLNVGWKGTLQYTILDGNNMVFGVCTSSVGANAS